VSPEQIPPRSSPFERLPLVTYTLLLEPPYPAVYVSPQLEQLFGYSPEDCLANTGFWTSKIAPEDRARACATLDRLRETREPVSVEYRVTALDGREVWVRETAVAAREVADVRMPHLDGLELARRVKATVPETAVLLYSGISDEGLVSDALDAGARGFALKDAPLDDLSRAIAIVAGGDLYVDPVLAAALASRRKDTRKPLSERERVVLRLLAEGGSYAEIGSTLFLSPDTVRAHAQRAMTKLGARTRTQAVAVALRDAVIG
jgi:two-component system response regulator DesR